MKYFLIFISASVMLFSCGSDNEAELEENTVTHEETTESVQEERAEYEQYRAGLDENTTMKLAGKDYVGSGKVGGLLDGKVNLTIQFFENSDLNKQPVVFVLTELPLKEGIYDIAKGQVSVSTAESFLANAKSGKISVTSVDGNKVESMLSDIILEPMMGGESKIIESGTIVYDIPEGN
ncbi:MAG: hypothetical protein Kapaf2KO_12750 [Candidatus Kapaibacteriales bacterium]